jgi:DNA-binding MarR family transcriptional regulator
MSIAGIPVGVSRIRNRPPSGWNHEAEEKESLGSLPESLTRFTSLSIRLDKYRFNNYPDGVPRRFDSPAQEAYLALWRTYDRMRAIEEAFFEPFGLSAQQYNLLRLLKAERPAAVPSTSLAARLISRAPDVTRMLDRLEERGLISRTRSDEDRRAVLVGLSDAGAELLKSIAGPLRKCHDQQLGHLSVDELDSLIDLLRRARAPHEPDDSAWK